jgi:hypothetical protein
MTYPIICCFAALVVIGCGADDASDRATPSAGARHVDRSPAPALDSGENTTSRTDDEPPPVSSTNKPVGSADHRPPTNRRQVRRNAAQETSGSSDAAPSRPGPAERVAREYAKQDAPIAEQNRDPGDRQAAQVALSGN